jgi:hypothetical protein
MMAALLVLLTRAPLNLLGEVITWMGLAATAALWMRRVAN